VAINLWKLGGRSTSYNPLPTNTYLLVNLPIGNYKLTFKAFSPSNATLYVFGTGMTTTNVKTGNTAVSFVLENTITSYEFTILNNIRNAPFHFYGGVNTDIIIEDIQLVEKPLGLPKRKLSPKVKVPRGKNLFDGLIEIGAISNTTGWNAGGDGIRSINHIPVKPNKTYTISNDKNYVNILYFHDIDKKFVEYSNVGAMGIRTFTTPPNCYFIRFRTSSVGENDLTVKFQLEEGSVATEYEPYKETLPPSRKGLVMDGVSNYLQLPPMTLDAIEIDCLIDGETVCLLDARNGLQGWIYDYTSSFANTKLNGVDINLTSANRLPKNRRMLVRVSNGAPFTDDVTVFATGSIKNLTKGILYGVKCFLNGQVVAEYDFTNPNTIVGDKVLQKARNLIPDFDDPRWSFVSPLKVLGKNIARLESSGSGHYAIISFPTKPNTTYLMTHEITIDTSQNFYIYFNGVFSGALTTGNKIRTIKSNHDTTQIDIRLGCASAGLFDFIRPQLYELDGKEGTLYGNPVSELKAPKRVLYAKR
jgi:hypothetical protein